MAIRNYSNTAPPVALTSPVAEGDQELPVGSTSEYPDAPFTLTINRRTVDEEVVLCTAKGPTSFTVERGYDGTTPKAHDADDPVEHVVAAIDYREANEHVNDTDLHGLGYVPIGAIVAYDGDPLDLPPNWVVCDGTNGTPDARDRFITGAGESYALRATGGLNQVTLTTQQIPAHSHVATSGTTTHGHSATSATQSTSHTHNVGNAAHSHGTNVGNNDTTHQHAWSTSGTGSHSHAIFYATNRAGGGNLNTFHPSESGAGPTTAGVQTATHSHSGTTGSANALHRHSVQVTGGTHGHGNTGNQSASHNHAITVNAESSHTHPITVQNAGGGAEHENRPPYVALWWIKRIS